MQQLKHRDNIFFKNKTDSNEKFLLFNDKSYSNENVVPFQSKLSSNETIFPFQRQIVQELKHGEVWSIK